MSQDATPRNDLVTPPEANPVYETAEPVLYAVVDGVAVITMNRPKFANSQNTQMTYALDAAFRRAAADDAVRVVVLKGAGKHFSAGHDIGTPGRDVNVSTPESERVTLWYDHVNKPHAEFWYAREQEVYLGMCRRWRELPKPTIAMVQGACIAGGLMLAWVCDLIIAADNAYFADPVLSMNIPGVEYFAHPFELHPRIAKEFLFLGEKMGVERAHQMGMVNRIVALAELETETMVVASRLAKQPRLGLALAKQAINHVEDLQGKRTAMDAVFHMHHFAHAQNSLASPDHLAGQDSRTMAAANREKANDADAGKGSS